MRTKLFSRLIAILMLSTGIGILFGLYMDHKYKTTSIENYLTRQQTLWEKSHNRRTGVTLGIYVFMAAGTGATMWPVIEILSSGIYWIIRPRNKSLTSQPVNLSEVP